jgi:hypothetical protein
MYSTRVIPVIVYVPAKFPEMYRYQIHQASAEDIVQANSLEDYRYEFHSAMSQHHTGRFVVRIISSSQFQHPSCR